MDRQQRGRDGEAFAASYLQDKGVAIIERDWRPPRGNELRGDIDLIGRDGDILCFIEVKARQTGTGSSPQLAVTRTKQRQLSRLANAYVSVHGIDDVPCRFDVVEVWLGQSGARAIWHCNAFDYQE